LDSTIGAASQPKKKVGKLARVRRRDDRARLDAVGDLVAQVHDDPQALDRLGRRVVLPVQDAEMFAKPIASESSIRTFSVLGLLNRPS